MFRDGLKKLPGESGRTCRRRRKFPTAKGPAACDANSRTPKKPNPLEQTLNQADENHDIVRGNTGYQTADGMG